MNHPNRQSIRLSDYDYTQPGAYFITICTHQRKPLLGFISDGKMFLTPNGKIVQSCWSEIKEHFPHIELSVFMVMPNHIHGVILIHEPVVEFFSRRTAQESFGKPINGS
jgi:putative transposase